MAEKPVCVEKPGLPGKPGGMAGSRRFASPARSKPAHKARWFPGSLSPSCHFPMPTLPWRRLWPTAAIPSSPPCRSPRSRRGPRRGDLAGLGPDRFRQDGRLWDWRSRPRCSAVRCASGRPTTRSRLIVAPTRELAMQVHRELELALRRHRRSHPVLHRRHGRAARGPRARSRLPHRGRHARPPVRPSRPRPPAALVSYGSPCWTRPMRCWTSASGTNSTS